MTEWRKTKKYNPSGPGYPEAGEYYVPKAEAEEKIAELQAEVARLEEERDDLCAALSGQTDRAVVAEAKLREANAEIERQQGLVRNYLETIEGNEIDISGLLEKLRAAEAFPNVLRARSEEYTHLSETGRALDAAADELEALLK